MPKYKLNESQVALLRDLQKNRSIREQEFLMQQVPLPFSEAPQDDGSTWYTIKVEILTGFDDPEAVAGLGNNAYFNAAYKDAQAKIREAFRTGEFTIYTIENSKRGVVEVKPEPRDDREKSPLGLT